MSNFERIETFVHKHAFVFLISCLFIGGVLGMLDEEAQERQTAHLAEVAEQAKSTQMQLKHICSQPWPDVKGGAEARAYVCPKE